MTSKEALEKLINDIEEQNEIVSKEPHLIINVKVNAEIFIPLLHNIKQDLDRLEKLEQKATPKTVKNKTRIKGVCLHCNGNVSIDENYCPRCGQRLEWL